MWQLFLRGCHGKGVAVMRDSFSCLQVTVPSLQLLILIPWVLKPNMVLLLLLQLILSIVLMVFLRQSMGMESPRSSMLTGCLTLSIEWESAPEESDVITYFPRLWQCLACCSLLGGP